MIRIERPRPPRTLTSREPAATATLRATYEADRPRVAAGEVTLGFDKGVYASEAVKVALRTAQHDKCAFCESKVTAVAYGDVEHFRPKAGWKQRPTDPLSRPGYFWLAYAWSNLLFACQRCNQRHKQNLFPLADPNERATPDAEDVSRETPLFIDPASEDPEAHIGFRGDVAFPVGDSPRGAATIAGLGLNRDELLEVRREHLVLLTALKEALDLFEGSEDPEARAWVRDARAKLHARTLPTASYTSMARCALRDAGL